MLDYCVALVCKWVIWTALLTQALYSYTHPWDTNGMWPGGQVPWLT